MVPWLNDDDSFPPVCQALGEDSPAPGLLAASESITAERLESAYQQGIFPWYSEGQPVLWWSTHPRMVLVPSQLKVSRSLRKTLQRVLADTHYTVKVDADFSATMTRCAATPRHHQSGTWITPDIISAYSQLHQQGKAHAVELWHDDMPVGGLYGVSLGHMFYGESMYAYATDTSKVALAALCAFLIQQGVTMIDCQQETAHLASLGAGPIPRDDFITHLNIATAAAPITPWQFDKSILRHWTK